MSTNDNSAPAVRGVIEGFYGTPFTHEQRLRLIDFLGRHDFDHYVYAPKYDPLHRARWREPYSAEEMKRFRVLAEHAAPAGVRFVYAIAPGLSYDAGDPGDFVRLADKIRRLLGCGVHGIALLFDDLAVDSTTLDPEVQATLVGRTHELVSGIDPSVTFWFIGNFYCGDVGERSEGAAFWRQLYQRSASEYFAAYAEHVPASVPILWTGPGVFSGTVGERDAMTFREAVGRPVVLWDNFPVNDGALAAQLFLGPYVGREPGALRTLHGVVLNLMPQAEANEIPLATAAEFFADPAGYDPERALRRAVTAAAQGPEATGALATFVAQHRGHPVLASADTAHELDARTRAAFGDGERSAAALAELRTHLDDLRANGEALRRSLGQRSLLTEIAPWSARLTELARTALLGLDALSGRGTREAYAADRELICGRDLVVAATDLPDGLLPFVVGQGPCVDRFARLFDALDAALGRL